MTALRPLLLSLLLSALSPLAQAFDLDQLSARLAGAEVVQGQFTQAKYLRAMSKPLQSRGEFVLSRQYGLLWLLRQPLQQDYRIDAQGIARRTAEGWQAVSAQSASAQQNRLFLAVLQGDRSGLERDFTLQLSGTDDAWQLTLNPRSLLLKQVFSSIRIDGGATVQRIELNEVQGDRSVIELHDNRRDLPLSEAQQHAFTD